MAIPLFLVFWIVDLFFYPDHKFAFLGIRLLIIPICLSFKKVLKYTDTYASSQIAITAYIISVSSILNLMNFIINDPSSGYYAGLNLVAIAGLSFIPLSRKYLVISTVGIYLPYYMTSMLGLTSHDKTLHLMQNTFFIVGSVVICSLIRFFNERLRVSEINSRIELRNEITSRDRIIVEKTLEAVNLHALSSQFSPQIVKAIRDGTITLEESVHRSRICAIFIDIVNSTERVVRLDQEKIQIVLARFLDTALTIFLKYDLTIDKFHGDGILAFSNDPVKREDFIERACLAAIETRQAIASDRDFYLLNWKDEMDVRIGISVGFANVGFYGDKKYFRSFTAIGAPLAFASRLTSLAASNQILIDAEIANVLLEQKFKVNRLGERVLKGFERNKNIVFELLEAPASNTTLKQSKTCPTHPNSVLFLDTNTKGHFIFKCRDCGYEDLSSINGENKSSVKAA